MIILKILNNNVAIARDDDKEVVIMGRGLVFGKKVGDFIHSDKIEKKFTEEASDFFEKFSEVISEIQPMHLEIVSEIVDFANDYLKTELNNNIYISLVDHINFALTRFKSDFEVKNALLWETKKFYQKEFAIGLKAIDIIFKRTGIKMSEDEAGFIALHIVNAEKGDLVNITQEVLKMIQDILSIISYQVGHIDEDSLNYTRLVTHLQFFARRILLNEKVDNDIDSLYEQVKEKYVDASNCVDKIALFLEKSHDIKIKNAEKSYLILHIQRTMRRIT